MARVNLPSFADVSELPSYLETSVPAEYEDANGHMNVTGYLRLHDQAAWPFMAALGMDDAYLADRRSSIFDLEHHLRYVAEMATGDVVRIHGRLIARSAKLLHAQFYLLDRTNEVLSNTLEFVSVHVSLETRRSTPWPDDVAAALDDLIAAHAGLAWDPPVSGALGVG